MAPTSSGAEITPASTATLTTSASSVATAPATRNAERPVRGGSRAAAGSGASGASLIVIRGRQVAERPAALLHQVVLDEPVDVAVEHAVDVSDLLLRAVILHELVRLQHVA